MGSDGFWHASSPTLIDAFCSVQIPDHLCEQYGYERGLRIRFGRQWRKSL